MFTSTCRHIRECHCAKEGGSFVCRYGYNGVCSSLPLEGVSDQDYEDHVLKHHAFTMHAKGREVLMRVDWFAGCVRIFRRLCKGGREVQIRVMYCHSSSSE